MTPNSIEPRVAIIGLGNVLLGDDGFGPFAVEVFRTQYECGPEIEIIDLGTPGLDLGPYLYGKDWVVIVDAVSAEGEPGTVRTYSEGEFLNGQTQLRLTDHDAGLQECLARLRLVGLGPSEVCVVGVIPESCIFGEGISSRVFAVISVAIDTLVQLLLERGFHCQRRSRPAEAKWSWDFGRRRNDYD